jgi:type I restriction enzyme M protein
MPPPRPEHVFAALAQPRLVELATIVQIRGADGMSHEQLVSLLATVHGLEYRELLCRLSLPELRRICARLGVRRTAGDAAELVDFLFAGKPLPSPLAYAVQAELARNAPPPPPRPARPPARGELGFEATLWHTADRLRSNLDAAEYKHVVLGLLFLKFIAGAGPPLRLVEDGAAPAARGFVVPPEARWQTLLAGAGAPTIARDLDRAMAAIEAHNPVLRGVLPQIYQRPGLDPARLRELLALLDTVDEVGPQDRTAHDVLGRVYEYFLSAFASAEGKNGGQYYTPPGVVALLVAMLAPTRGAVYDPACGSGGMFVQSGRWFAEHGGARTDLRFYGQESNATTWRLAKMNLAVRGIEGDLGPEPADSFARDLHPDLRADYVLANPPFNMKAWSAVPLEVDPRFEFGKPPPQNANFAWLQHIVHHMAPRGLAAVVLANGSLTVGGREGEIRRALVDADLVDAVVALPGQLFYSTAIPVCVWLLARDKSGRRDRRGRVLLLDARDAGEMIGRTHRALRPQDIAELAAIVHAWRGDPVPEGMSEAPYQDRLGRCRAVTRDLLAAHDYNLSPARHVAPAAAPSPARDFAGEFAVLRDDLLDQLARGAALDSELTAALARIRVP